MNRNFPPMDGVRRRPLLIILGFLALTVPPGSSWGGASGWMQQSSGTMSALHGVHFSSADHGVAVGQGGVVLRTTDGGANWTPSVSGVSDDLLAVSFGDASHGIAVGQLGTLIYTGDEGASWTVARSGWIDTFFGVHMLDSQRGWAVGVNGIFQPFVARTLDGGATWSFSAFYIDGNEGQLRDVHFFSTDVGVAVGNLWDGRGAIVRTIDGGASWTRVLLPSQPLTSVDFAGGTGLASGFAGSILRTTDAGLSWTSQASGTAANLYGVSLPTAGTGYAAGAGGTIVATVDGTTWNPQVSGVGTDLRAVAFLDSLSGFAVGHAGVILSTDTGGEVPTSVAGEGAGALIARSLTFSASPNPFVGMTRFQVEDAEYAGMRIDIFDPAGRMVRVLDAGTIWDGTDTRGRRLTPGVYFARCQLEGSLSGVTRVVMLR